jgi:segregation and condensation protein B
MMKEEKIAVLEALIFASEAPLTPERAADVLTDTEKKEILSLLEELGREYETRGGGIVLVPVAGGYQFRTKPEMAPWIRKLKASRPAMLSPAALETLAVIAYRQPLVKSEVDRIRGVDASGALKGLLEKKLVRIVGRKDVPGKPIIYGTTKRFLEVFNLQDLSELPTLRELKDLQDDSNGQILGGMSDSQGGSCEPTLQESKDLPDDGSGPPPEVANDFPGENGEPKAPELKELPRDGGEQWE